MAATYTWTREAIVKNGSTMGVAIDESYYALRLEEVQEQNSPRLEYRTAPTYRPELHPDDIPTLSEHAQMGR